MSEPETFQLSDEAAEVYEAKFVPALFAKWAPHLVDATGVAPGQTVLDVACGTGIVARHVADRLHGRGRVVGVDVNAGMLAVARRLRPDIEWRRADAADLPFPDASIDRVLCQAALMFFQAPRQALREMARVVTPAGRVGLQVWGALEAQAGWAPFYDVIRRHAGPDAIDLVGSYWRLGDLDALTALCAEVGLPIQDVRTRHDTATFASVEEFVSTEVAGTPLQERIDEQTHADIVADARTALASFRTPTGSLEVPISGHILIVHPGRGRQR
jgi:SAM-dependent methyltransferase